MPGKSENGNSSAGESSEPKEQSTSSLVVVAFLGSLDDLTLFVPMLVGQALTWIELSKSTHHPHRIFDSSSPFMHLSDCHFAIMVSKVLGVVVATGLILSICFFLVRCKPVANFLQAIPLCAIVLLFGTFLLVKALLMT